MKEFIIKDHSDKFSAVADIEVIVKIDSHSNLTDVLESFERFLKACGYYFDGRLEIVDDENPNEDSNSAYEEDEI